MAAFVDDPVGLPRPFRLQGAAFFVTLSATERKRLHAIGHVSDTVHLTE